MGGIGSSRWGSYSRKTRVEECAVFDLDAWVSAGLLTNQAGRIEWTDPHSGYGNWALYLVKATDVPSCKYVDLFYPDGGGKQCCQPTTIISKSQTCGDRWYFFCYYCHRLVRKLFRKAGVQFYACRRCHDLSYRSAQEHDTRLDAFRRNPGLLKAAVKSGSLLTAKFVLGNLMRWRERNTVTVSGSRDPQ